MKVSLVEKVMLVVVVTEGVQSFENACCRARRLKQRGSGLSMTLRVVPWKISRRVFQATLEHLCEYPQDWKMMSQQSLHLQSFLSRSLREWKNRRPLIVYPPRRLFREMNGELWKDNRKRTN